MSTLPSVAHRLPSRCMAASATLAAWLALGAFGPASAVAAPSEGDLAQLCAAHGSECNCPGCRAYFHACQQPCPSDCTPALPPEGPYEGAEGVPAEPSTDAMAPDAMASDAAPTPLSGPMPSLASMGALASTSSAAPSMIGDFFGAGYNYSAGSPANGATVGVAGGDRLLKFSDNNSPIPQNRLFFNYHNFDDSVVDVNGDVQDTNRFLFGLERTFWDGNASIEFRTPFTASVDAQQQVDSPDTLAAEFGNMALAVKGLIAERGPWSVGAGLGMIFPTAEDNVIYNDRGEEAVRFSNDAFYLQPFIGVYCRPSARLFTQFVTQVNFDVSGNVVTVSDPTFFGGTGSDRIFEQSLLFLDYSVGYWVYRAHPSMSYLTGIAPMVELHYATTMEDLDLPNINTEDPIFETDFRSDALNITGGVIFEIGPLTSLRLAGVAPLRDGTDRIFDAEFGMQLIRRY